MDSATSTQTPDIATIESRIQDLIARMTLAEKIGQLCVVNTPGDATDPGFRKQLVDGRIGAIINDVEPERVAEFQRVVRDESRLGIPLLVGRDVIHGFATVFPIPLGQAASWSPALVRDGARIAAREAAACGINWTYAPMLDIGRDPRWGRVAETLGEDPYLTSVLGVAMIEGFQGGELSDHDRLAACAKHFAGYGASESGTDYNTTNIPENELRNVHLPPFKAAADAGVASFMTSFSDLDGIPASANEFLLRQVLREEWQSTGMVVSDWESVSQLAVHGLTEGDRESALAAANAGVDMEMASNTYAGHFQELIDSGQLTVARVDEMVANVLRVKARLGLLDDRPSVPADLPPAGSPDALELAHTAAVESCVLLRNENGLLPLDPSKLSNVAVIGPMADDAYEQLGTWVFDGDSELSRTPLTAIQEVVNSDVDVRYFPALDTTRDRNEGRFAEAVAGAQDADVAILVLGEEAILSGEAHCRADIRLPGAQEALVHAIAATGTPVVAVILAGRPLALQDVIEDMDALLYAWHPGTMAGPAIADLLFGRATPQGKLPVTFPRVTGQVPMYYAHKNTGRPPTPETVRHLDEIEKGAPQHSFGNTSFHLDVPPSPLFPFGHGLSYTRFDYSDFALDRSDVPLGETVTASATLTNTGDRDGVEIVQLYVRDRVGSVTRPVRELKGFQRVPLAAGESCQVRFTLSTDDLAFHDRQMRYVTEPGQFDIWIGGDSTTDLGATFTIISPESA